MLRAVEAVSPDGLAPESLHPRLRRVKKLLADGADRAGGKVFLPFEGDEVLALILSKAFLLAKDDKITDETIVAQIRR